MKFKDMLKQYWFVTLVAVIFVGFIGYFVYGRTKDLVKGKTISGKDVVVSIEGKNVTADDLYTKLLDSSAGKEAVYQLYEKLILDATIKTDKNIESEAKLSYDGLIDSYKQYYGASEYKNYLQQAMTQVGLKTEQDLRNYLLLQIKREKLTEAYVKENIATLFDKYYTEKNPRTVRHILVKMADPAKPTEAETKKLEDVKKAIAEGKDFADIAKQYSDDGSASKGGDLGFMDKDTQFVKEFLEAGLALKKGEAKWVQTTYGMHYIQVVETDKAALMKLDGATDALVNYDTTLTVKAIKEAAVENKVKFSDEKLQKVVDDYLATLK